MKLGNVMISANAVLEATKILKNNPELARKLIGRELLTDREKDVDLSEHDLEIIEGIPTWKDACVVADDFVSEGARINILTDDDGSYKVLADFGRFGTCR